ncbi:MAG: IMPACT family protein [Anaerovoracaceae bacterium]|jgi:uncharacterized YigZ family protein
MILYKTAAAEAHAEQIIKKSRFIAHVKPVGSRDEAEEYIAAVRKQYRDATNNVPAMVLGDKFQIQWASDDGEPQGTGGAPVMQLAIGMGVTDVVIVVTRYFGGIKLGTGGLVRAYTGCAREALLKAGIREVREMYAMTVKIGYPELGRLQNLARGGDFEIGSIKYEDMVTIELLCDSEKEAELKKLISDITGGQEKIVSEVVKSA